MKTLRFQTQKSIFVSALALSAALLFVSCAKPNDSGTRERARNDLADSRPTQAVKILGRGEATFYNADFQGQETANGEKYDGAQLTAAHRNLPFDSKVRVTNVENGRSVTVRINDRGPFVQNRIIDLSAAAAKQLHFVKDGVATVELALIKQGNAN